MPVRFVFILSALLFACEQSSGDSGPMTILVDSGRGLGQGGQGGNQLPVADMGEGMGGQGGMGGEAMGGMGGEGQGGMGGEDGCPLNETRCPEEGDPFVQRCRPDGRWAIEACAEGEVCLNGACLPDPGDCMEGETICLDAQQPGVCVPGEGWRATERCAGDQRCVDGVCSALACAEAARQRSYLGCDYLAVDLPNSAFRQPGGTTPDAPVGVVVANPDFGNPVHVTVFDPQGAVAQLVDNRRIPIPDIPDIAGLPPQTVSSEVQDADGMVVSPMVGRAEQLEIPAGGQATLLLPRNARPDSNSGVSQSAYRIVTDRPVAAYQFSPYCCNYSFSNDASLLFPTSALGLDYRFVGVPSWSLGLGEGNPAGIAIVATEDNTEVTVNLPGPNLLIPDPGQRIPFGQAPSFRLNAQEVALLQATQADPFGGFPPLVEPDLTGAHITSSAPVAVFSTHQCSFYPQLSGACDHLEEQLFPTGTWGNIFVLSPIVRRGGPVSAEAVYWKILARDAGTRVTLSVPFEDLNPIEPGFAGVPNCRDALQADGTLLLDNPTYCEFGTMHPVQITGDGPLTVMGIISGQESTGTLMAFGAQAGDPAIFLVPPDRQYRQDYAFLTPATYANDYLTIVADPGATIELDGAPIDLGDAVPVPGSNRAYKHVRLERDGPHRVAGNRPFGILVFAYDDFVSYAFTGGLNLEKR